jgi:hypothetical protein
MLIKLSALVALISAALHLLHVAALLFCTHPICFVHNFAAAIAPTLMHNCQIKSSSQPCAMPAEHNNANKLANYRY